MAETRFGTFQELLEMTALEMRPVAEELRNLAFEIHPDAVEVVRLGDRAATYGIGPKKMSQGYAYILPHTSWVNLGFYQGARLPDPEGLLEGTGARMRHVKLRSKEETRLPGVRRLLEEALHERRAALES